MKKSENNLALIQNFILHITHSSDTDTDVYYKNKMTFTPESLYKSALDYIEEDHIDGKEGDHIVTYSTESSFLFEDKDKKYPEQCIIVANGGEEWGTCTCASFDADQINEVSQLLSYIDNPHF